MGVLLINKNVVDYDLFILDFLSELIVRNIYILKQGFLLNA